MDNNDKRCHYIMSDGSQCRGYHQKNSLYCFMHDPDKKETRTLVVKDGGLSKQITLNNKIVKLKRGKARDVIKALAQTIGEVREGIIPPAVANSMILGMNSLLKAFEIFDIEKKLGEIEGYLEERKNKNELQE